MKTHMTTARTHEQSRNTSRRAPDSATQEARLRGRDTDDEAQLQRRLETARREEALADRFDAVVVNDAVERAAGEVAAILEARRTAPPPTSP